MEDQPDPMNGAPPAEEPAKPHVDRYNEESIKLAETLQRYYKHREVHGQAPIVDTRGLACDVALLEATVGAILSAICHGRPEVEVPVFNTIVQNLKGQRASLLEKIGAKRLITPH